MRLSLLVCVLLASLSACAPEGPTGFVTGSLVPDGECVYSSSGEVFQSVGHYDIAPGVNGACDVPYRIHLQLNSYLRSNGDPDLGRAEPNILRVHSAEVRLMNLQRQTLAFVEENPPLPNPFLVTSSGTPLMAAMSNEPTKGVAAVEVIPVAYAPYLIEFVGDQIIAEIQMFGTTTGDVDIEMQPFRYPIEICNGCLTECATVLDTSVGLDELEGCQDNAGADGRVCYDPDCAAP